MGMDLSTYIGPYLVYVAGAKHVESYDLTDGRLCDVVNESSSHPFRVILPNVGKIGHHVSEHDPGLQVEVEPSDIVGQLSELSARFAQDIETIRKKTQVRVVWGIVSYWL